MTNILRFTETEHRTDIITKKVSSFEEKCRVRNVTLENFWIQLHKTNYLVLQEHLNNWRHCLNQTHPNAYLSSNNIFTLSIQEKEIIFLIRHHQQHGVNIIFQVILRLRLQGIRFPLRYPTPDATCHRKFSLREKVSDVPVRP